MFDGQADWQYVLAALAVVAAGSRGWARGSPAGATAAAMRGVLGDSLLSHEPARARARCGWSAAAAFLLIFAVLLFPALELAGLKPRTGVHLRRARRTGRSTKGLPLLATIVICYALVRITGLLVTRFEHELNRGTSLDALERAKRARTLGSVINKVVTIALSAVALLMVLHGFGLNIAPVLTGAGILGLAVGFGAQTLVRDVISGFFLILEDQVRVGDVAAINGTRRRWSRRSTCAPSCCATAKARFTSSRTAPSRRSPTAARTSPTTSSISASPIARIPIASPRCCARSARRCRPIRPTLRGSSSRSRSWASTRSATGRWCSRCASRPCRSSSGTSAASSGSGCGGGSNEEGIEVPFPVRRRRRQRRDDTARTRPAVGPTSQ